MSIYIRYVCMKEITVIFVETLEYMTMHLCGKFSIRVYTATEYLFKSIKVYKCARLRVTNAKVYFSKELLIHKLGLYGKRETI